MSAFNEQRNEPSAALVERIERSEYSTKVGTAVLSAFPILYVIMELADDALRERLSDAARRSEMDILPILMAKLDPAECEEVRLFCRRSS